MLMEMNDVMFTTLVGFREELRRTALPAVSMRAKIIDELKGAYDDFNRAFNRFDRGIMQVDEMRRNGASAEDIESHIVRIQQELRAAIAVFEKKVAAPNE